MSKIYVLDTNVLVQAPGALLSFEENEVVLPLVVVEELDNLKKEEGEKGANVREAIRLLEKFREKGNLLEGVETPEGVLEKPKPDRVFRAGDIIWLVGEKDALAGFLNARTD